MIAMIDDRFIFGYDTKQQLDDAVKEFQGVEFFIEFSGETSDIPLEISEEMFGKVADAMESFPSCVAEAFIETEYCLIYS